MKRNCDGTWHFDTFPVTDTRRAQSAKVPSATHVKIAKQWIWPLSPWDRCISPLGKCGH